jgi:uncharacterized protein YchJ
MSGPRSNERRQAVQAANRRAKRGAASGRRLRWLRAALPRWTRSTDPREAERRPGRNDSCPCGSGKKYKICCGKQ